MIRSALLAKINNIDHGFLMPQESSPESITGKQIHKASWLWAPSTLSIPHSKVEVDALATNHKNVSIGVYSADCVPLLVAALDDEANAVSVMAIHAGWRGSAQRISARVVQAWLHILAVQFAKPTKLVVAIGPCIHQESFEVGEEVVAGFCQEERKFGTWLKNDSDREKYLFDLVGVNKEQIGQAAKSNGIALELETLPQCTFADPDMPSFRRDGKNAGRIFSRIQLLA
jgi:polyphenol oxidase